MHRERFFQSRSSFASPPTADVLESRRLLSAPGANYTLSFDDEFNGTSLNTSKWSMYLPWNSPVSGDNRFEGGNYISYMMPDDVNVANGMLTLTTEQRNETAPSGAAFNYTSGMITTNQTFWQTYGYAEIRAELPTGYGNWPAFWTLSTGWPPENDIMEAWPGNPTLHQGLYDMTSTWDSVYPTYPAENTWHTYGLAWSPGSETFYYDGTPTLTVTKSAVPSEPMYLLLNSAVAAGQTNGYSNSNNNALNVDYVRVYTYTPTPGSQLTNGGFDTSGGYTLSGGASIVNVPTSSRTGTGDLQVLGAGEADQTITGLSPDTTYTFSGYGEIGSGGAVGYLGVKNYGGSTITDAVGAAAAWTSGAVTFTTGPNSTSATVFCQNPSTYTSGNLDSYDDMALTLGPTIGAMSTVTLPPSASTSVTIPPTTGSGGSFDTLTATSSNPSLLSNAGLTVSGSSLQITPIANQTGSATITVTATDIFGGTATTSFVLNVLPVLTLNGDNGGTAQNDVFRLVRDGALLDVYLNNATSTPTAQYPYANYSMVSLNGLAGDDSLTLDYSGGDPVLVDGLAFNGGAGSNSLTVENLPGGDSATLGTGSLQIGSDAITLAEVQSVKLDLGSGASTLGCAGGSFGSVLNLTVDPASTLTLAANAVLPSSTVVNLSAGGTMNLAGNSESIDQLSGTGTLNNGGGTLTLGAAGGSSTFAGSIAGTGGLTETGAGAFTLAGSNTYTGTTTVNPGATIELAGSLAATASVIANGNFTFAASTGSSMLTQTIGSLAIGATGDVVLATSSSAANRMVLVANTLDITPGGSLDLGNNDMVIHSSMSTLLSLLQSGFAAGAWNGPGISSSAAAVDRDKAIGWMLNNDGNGNALMSSFDGVSVTSADTLLKYTVFGDANLDGTIDGADYLLTDNGFALKLTGWRNGDFNYDGVVNGDDYSLLDNALQSQLALNPKPAVANSLSVAGSTQSSAVSAAIDDVATSKPAYKASIPAPRPQVASSTPTDSSQFLSQPTTSAAAMVFSDQSWTADDWL